MDDELFRKKLSEVAKWMIPAPTKTQKADKGLRKRGRKSIEELYQDDAERKFLEENGGINPTLPPEVIELNCQPRICEDCGKSCENGRHVDYKLIKSNNKMFVRPHCITCNKHQDPYTKEFCLNGTQASIKWQSYMKPVKTRHVRPSKSSNDSCARVIHENSKEIITIYSDDNEQA